jgi:hypothetical protein
MDSVWSISWNLDLPLIVLVAKPLLSSIPSAVTCFLTNPCFYPALECAVLSLRHGRVGIGRASD